MTNTDETVSISQKLWNDNISIAQDCLAHPFVRGIGDGCLSHDAFKVYVGQDAFFLRSFFKAYALGASRCDDEQVSRAFYGLMGGVLEEIELHKKYAEKFAIDLSRIRPIRSCQAYTDFLLRVAHTGYVDEILAAMVPCMRLYAFLGSELSKDYDDTSMYKEWITTYSARDFQLLVEKIEHLLDSVYVRGHRVEELYGYAMQCELSFFDGPLREVEHG